MKNALTINRSLPILANALLANSSKNIPVLVQGTQAYTDYNKIIVPFNDPDPLAQAILRLLGNTSMLKKMGESARKRALSYEIARIGPMYETGYKAVLD